jgi:ribosome-associated heat shock protein Hsp15
VTAGASERMRLDKWLWRARFFKTRSLATRVVADGQVRVNGTRVTKPAQGVTLGDVLTFAQGHAVRVVRIAGLGERRGPACASPANTPTAWRCAPWTVSTKARTCW